MGAQDSRPSPCGAPLQPPTLAPMPASERAGRPHGPPHHLAYPPMPSMPLLPLLRGGSLLAHSFQLPLNQGPPPPPLRIPAAGAVTWEGGFEHCVEIYDLTPGIKTGAPCHFTTICSAIGEQVNVVNWLRAISVG